jgi:hypothetical protein
MDQLKSILDSVTRPPTPDNTSNFVKNCHRLNICFSGTCDGQVLVFLEKLTDLQRRLHVSDVRVFEVLPELLTDAADTWFRAFKQDLLTFEDVCVAIKKAFLPPSYESKLLNEIRNRRMAPGESICEFVSKIRATNYRLSQPLADPELVDIVKQNSRPDYTYEFYHSDVKSFEQILASGRMVEELARLREEYRPPQRHSKFDSTLDWGGNSLSSAVVATITEPPVVAAAAAADVSSVVCFNCKKVGHLQRDCREPRQLFCYRCGKAGFTSRTCTCARGGGGRPQVN